MTEAPYVLKSISELARHYGVSKQAVSKAVKKLLAHDPDTPIERNAQGNVVRVSVAHYDLHRQGSATTIATVAVFEDNPDADKPVAASHSFEEARRQAEWLKVGFAKIRDQEERGDLVRLSAITATTTDVGRDIRAMIQRLPNCADDMAIAVSRNGSEGARSMLRRFGDDLAAKIWKRLGDIPAASGKGARSQDDISEDE